MNIRLGLVSAYSFLFGVHKPAALLEKCASFGVKAVSICDINNLYGLHSFLEAAKERNIRPVIGSVLTLSENPSAQDQPVPLPCTQNYVYCFAENRAGFSRLCEILSVRNKDSKNFDPLPLLRGDSDGLCLASANARALKELAGRVKRLYCAVTPDDLGGISCARALNLPPAFLDSSVFLEQEDYRVHRVLRAIGLNKTAGSLNAREAIGEGKGMFRTSGGLSSFLDSWPCAARGTAQMAEICQFNEIFDGFIFPSYGEDPVTELRKRVYAGAASRYGELGDMEIDRIEYELEIIEKMGFAPYFLRIDDIVGMAPVIEGGRVSDNSREGLRYRRRTCGRGSGAASVVSYSLGITNVDPIAHNLYFERFLSPARPDPPDIDIDFAWDERDELITSVIEKFDGSCCARVANHNFFRSRSALRETAKAYGFPDAAITALERKLFDLREKEEDIDPLWKEIYTIAAKIEGLPRGLSMHCGGLVITPGKICRYAPVEKSLEGYPLLAWEKEGAEAAGFVKIDLLGNRSLAVIRDAVKNVEEEGIATNDELTSRLERAVNDRATIDALARGDSIGVFYIESPSMRQLQKKTGAGDFDHIVIHSSIIRPAANKFICEYVRRLKGGAWEHLHPRLEKILDETYGILCYQEDVSKTAAALAGFDEAGADRLRKIIAKKAGAEKLKVYERQFFEGCRKNNVDEKTINEIWAMMLSFDGYSFCKPHSASYAMVSFQSAYLRVHHPAEFMAAVLSNQGGFYRPGAYISECRRMKLITEGPDVNISQWRYYGISGGNETYRGTVVIGLMAVKGLSISGANAVMDERERGGNFSSLDDFSRRVKLSRDDIEALCPSGAFDSISDGLSRPLQARRLLSRRNIELKVRNGKPQAKNHELFCENTAPVNPHDDVPRAAAHFPAGNSALTALNILWEEFNSLGFLRNVHPLFLWKDDVSAVKGRVKASRIGDYRGRSVKMAGWPVTQKDVWTKDGLSMCFLSLEDETGIYETVVFPQIYDRYNRLLFDQQPLLVFGRVKDDQGAVILELDRIELLTDAVRLPDAMRWPDTAHPDALPVNLQTRQKREKLPVTAGM